MKIIGMKSSNQVSKLEHSMGTKASGVVPSELSLGAVKQKGGQVFRTNDGYIVRGMSAMPTKAFLDLVKKDNGIVEVKYKDGIEDNDQISSTESPLWNVDKNGGEFHIKRNF